MGAPTSSHRYRRLPPFAGAATLAAAAGLVVGFAPTLVAGAAGKAAPGGSSGGRGTSPAVVATTVLKQLHSFNLDGGYAAAGVALRDLGHGTIHLTTLPTGAIVQKAYLFWDLLATTKPSTSLLFDSNFIPGTSIARGTSPCWSPKHNYAFQANVTPYVPGNGTYTVSSVPSSLTTGATPQASGAGAVLDEGATLVVVYKDKTSPSVAVHVYGGAQDNQTTTGYDQNLAGFTVATHHAATTFIVADGQSFSDTGATFDGSRVVSTFTGHTPMTNPTYTRYPGTTSGGGGNLWDTDTVTVGTLVTPGATSATASIHGFTSDCIVWVGQVFATSIPLAAPTGVAVTPGSGQATVAWTKVALATRYEVFDSTTPTGENYGGTPACRSAGRMCTVKHLTNGTTYYFTVVATAATVTSPHSLQVSATPSLTL